MFQRKNRSTGFPMEQQTKRLILRVASTDYLHEVQDFHWRNRGLFEQFEPTLPENYYTLEHQQALLKCEFQMALKMETIRYYVFLKENPAQLIGTVCLHDIRRFSYSCCEIGYKFDANYQHMGYAAEAVAAALEIAFASLSLHRVFARVLPSNIPSIRLLQRLGFKSEGIEQECIQIHGKWADHQRFARIAPKQKEEL